MAFGNCNRGAQMNINCTNKNFANNINVQRSNNVCADDRITTIDCSKNMQKKCENPTNDAPKMVLAMAYVLPQKFNGICQTMESFCNGTVFSELVKPFVGRGGIR